jgi:integrative and conjugative element protein (TIGR02256 family)
MRLSITRILLDRLIDELRRARRREIGGVLVGEHQGSDDFALVGLSVQRRGGGRSHFQRDPIQAARFVDAAIAQAGGDAQRVNYLGEWHSHPSFSASPSVTDTAQMQSIVDDPDEPATFAVLIVVSGRRTGLEMSATLFRGGHRPEPVDVKIVGAVDKGRWTMVPSDPAKANETKDDDDGRPHGAPCENEGSDEWRRSRTGSTRRPWWRRWLASVW